MENTIENATAFLDELSDAFPKMRFSQAMVEYANSVRPDVVVPSEEDKRRIYISMGMNGSFGHVWSACIKEIKRLNQTLTFTENHEK